MKTCCKCKQSKPLSEFYKDASRKDGYHPSCKLCSLSQRHSYVARNQERVKDYFRNRYQTDDKYRQRQKSNAEINYYSKTKEKKAKHQEWLRQNPDYQRVRYANEPDYREKKLNYSKKRKALRKGAETAELVDRAEIIKRDNAICYICGKGPLPNSEIHLDHIIPLNQGGPHTPENIRIACISCNCKKQDKSINEVIYLIETGLW